MKRFASTPSTSKATACAVACAMVFPSVLTWTYFEMLAHRPPIVQQSVYVVGKTLQFGFPLLWALCVAGEKIQWPWPSRRGLTPGIAFGLLVCLAMAALYFGAFKPFGLLVQPGREVRAKILQLGLQQLWKYAAVGVFYALCHSLLEEYYWRWFVFGRMRAFLPLPAAIAVSSAGFTAHHLILLARYFGWQSPWTYLLCLGIAAGGAVWAAMYQRSGSLYGPWASHGLVDAAIFALGFDLAGDMFLGRAG